MKKKLNLVIFFILISTFILACTPHIYYIKPEVIGKIYDSETRAPISNKKGYIAFFLSEDEHNYVYTSQTGNFSLKPISESYYFIKPKLDMHSTGAPDIYINFKGYKQKTIDYNEGGISLDNRPNPGAKRPGKVDVGIIYLEPEK